VCAEDLHQREGEKDRRTTQLGMFAEICSVRFKDVYQVAVRCRNRIRKKSVTRCMSFLIAALTLKVVAKATLDPESYSESTVEKSTYGREGKLEQKF
jgi:hypothetical protein